MEKITQRGDYCVISGFRREVAENSSLLVITQRVAVPKRR